MAEDKDQDKGIGITEAVRSVLKVSWAPGQTEEQFAEEHFRQVVRKEKRQYTMTDRLAVAMVRRAVSDGAGGASAVKEIIDRTEGPVLRKADPNERKQSYVVVLPLPVVDPKLTGAEQWEKLLAENGVVRDKK